MQLLCTPALVLLAMTVANGHHSQDCSGGECSIDTFFGQTVKLNQGANVSLAESIYKANAAEMDRRRDSSIAESSDQYKYKKTSYECVSSGIDTLTGDYVVRIPGQKVRDINRIGKFLNLDTQQVLVAMYSPNGVAIQLGQNFFNYLMPTLFWMSATYAYSALNYTRNLPEEHVPPPVPQPFNSYITDLEPISSNGIIKDPIEVPPGLPPAIQPPRPRAPHIVNILLKYFPSRDAFLRIVNPYPPVEVDSSYVTNFDSSSSTSSAYVMDPAFSSDSAFARGSNEIKRTGLTAEGTPKLNLTRASPFESSYLSSPQSHSPSHVHASNTRVEVVYPSAQSANDIDMPELGYFSALSDEEKTQLLDHIRDEDKLIIFESLGDLQKVHLFDSQEGEHQQKMIVHAKLTNFYRQKENGKRPKALSQ